jgi:cytosine/adenosine deaminase-related metal-dependent hydrolase
MATWNPARFLGRDDVWVIGKGKIADLIILNGNPLEDITVLQQRVILKDGAFVECRIAARNAAQPTMKSRSYSTSELC